MRLPTVRFFAFLVLPILAALAPVERAWADVQGFNPANACASNTGTGAGTTAWTNPGGASASGINYASAGMMATGSSQYLACSDFRFSVPTGSVIDAVTMRTSHRRNSGAVVDLHVCPVRTDGATNGCGASNRARTNCATDDWTNAFNPVTYANPALPPWGVTWEACAASQPT
jgi:hypothetical protein